MWGTLVHRMTAAGTWIGYRRFRVALDDPETTQRRRLRAILRYLAPTGAARVLGLSETVSYERFAASVPLMDADALAVVVRRHQDAPGERWLVPEPVQLLPTSGSTSARKWVPTTRAFGFELDAAVAAWIHDIGRRHGGVLSGRHYWSLSWMPDELRETGAGTDDLDLLPAPRRWALGRIMAVPTDVARLPRSAGARRATLVHLAACRDLSLISVWSPTFLLTLLDDLDAAREPVSAVLERGRWDAAWPDDLGSMPEHAAPRDAEAARILRDAPAPLDPAALFRLWPRLRLVSAWDSSTAAPFARMLRRRLSHAGFQGKGLWATEGVVSIPFADRYPAAVTSHFLEFRCLHTGRLHPAWELETDQELQPVLTTSAGLLRYVLADRVRVVGHLARTPCLRFLGRLDGVDLVGEKLDAALADAVLRAVEARRPVRCVCLIGLVSAGSTPRYALLAEPLAHTDSEDVAGVAEKELRKVHHYAVARDLGQLAPVETWLRADALRAYQALRGTRGIPEGAEKIEPVVQLTGPIDDALSTESRARPSASPAGVGRAVRGHANPLFDTRAKGVSR